MVGVAGEEVLRGTREGREVASEVTERGVEE